MDAWQGRDGMRLAGRWLGVWLLAGMAATAVPAGADACSTRSKKPLNDAICVRQTQQQAVRALAAQDRALRRMEGYYRRLLERRERGVVFVPNRLRSLIPLSDGTLPDSAYVDFLRWRRSLNPRQFDAYHPCLWRQLVKDQVIRGSVKPGTEPSVRPGAVRPGQIGDDPPMVPEPPAYAILLGLFGVAAWAQRRGRRLATVRLDS